MVSAPNRFARFYDSRHHQLVVRIHSRSEHSAQTWDVGLKKGSYWVCEFFFAYLLLFFF